jgi:hypothetical protein
MPAIVPEFCSCIFRIVPTCCCCFCYVIFPALERNDINRVLLPTFDSSTTTSTCMHPSRLLQWLSPTAGPSRTDSVKRCIFPIRVWVAVDRCGDYIKEQRVVIELSPVRRPCRAAAGWIIIIDHGSVSFRQNPEWRGADHHPPLSGGSSPGDMIRIILLMRIITIIVLTEGGTKVLEVVSSSPPRGKKTCQSNEAFVCLFVVVAGRSRRWRSWWVFLADHLHFFSDRDLRHRHGAKMSTGL